MQYQGNPKHKEPWQRGRKGSLCPAWATEVAQVLLDSSDEYGGKRYAVRDGQAFCAQLHGPDAWHGYPVGWIEVPEKLRRRWRDAGRFSRAQIHKFWRT